MDVEAWLKSLGLERYVPAFRDNAIDWQVLPRLTSDDLREIGVAAVGHRRSAHEDDAERAVCAALGVIEAIGRLDVRSGKLQARVGIATGLVMVWRAGSRWSSFSRTRIGSTRPRASCSTSRSSVSAACRYC